MCLFIYKYQVKTNKCLINTKNGLKNIFNILMLWEKINKSETTRKSQKMIKISTMGQGGSKVKTRCK